MISELIAPADAPTATCSPSDEGRDSRSNPSRQGGRPAAGELFPQNRVRSPSPIEPLVQAARWYEPSDTAPGGDREDRANVVE